MPSFGSVSKKHRSTLHPDLQRLCDEVIKYVDYSIVCGHRGEADQNRAFNQELSKVQFPNGKHNSLPSKAVDVSPYPLNWNDREAFTLLSGIFLGVAFMLGIKIRIGSDWDGDFNMLEHTFIDRPHIELVD
jgi:hypothetical protein